MKTALFAGMFIGSLIVSSLTGESLNIDFLVGAGAAFVAVWIDGLRATV